MKQNPILSIGLKGKTAEVNRMKELMGNMNINENTSRSIIELVKVGPDGNSYAIVRENHEYFIKSANKSKNVLAEDFDYIGGLKNKRANVYTSYSEATKHLNLKFISLNEVYNQDIKIDLYNSDDILVESDGETKGVTSMGFKGKEEEIKEDLDPVGKEDADVNNDGKEDKQDDYIKNKRSKISNAIEKIDEEISNLLKKKF